MGPIHLRTIKAGVFDLETWRDTRRTEEEAAKARSLAQARDAIGKQSALFEELLPSCFDADFRAAIEMFGSKGSRGCMMVSLVLSTTLLIALSCSPI